MESTLAIKLPLVVDDETARILDGQSRICNWLYNQLVEHSNRLRSEFCETQDPEVGKILYAKRGLRNLVPSIKKDHPFLKTVHSSPLKNTALRVTDCVQSYQKSRKGQRKGRQTGWPKFRKWSHRWFSLFYDEPNKGFKLNGDVLRLSLGLLEDGTRLYVTVIMKDAKILSGQPIRNCRIVKQQGVFFVVFTVVKALPTPKPIKKIIALDPNHKNLSVGFGTDGRVIKIEAPHWLKTYDKRIDELKSKRDRCLKKSRQVEVLDHLGNPTGNKRFVSSRRWRYLNKVLERVLAQRREQIKTYCYTMSNRLCREYDLIAIGDYTPRGGGMTRKMRRGMNNRSTIGTFKQILSWVALKSGKHFVEYDERGTTRTCHQCEAIVADGISPSIRLWQCSNCHVIHDRDENSAIRGLREVLRNNPDLSCNLLQQMPCSGHAQVSERCTWRVHPSGVRSTLRGMSSKNIASAKKLNCLRGSSQPKMSHAEV